MISQRTWQTCFYPEIKMLKEKGMDIYYSENQSMGKVLREAAGLEQILHLFCLHGSAEEIRGVKKWRGQNLIIAERS